MLGYTEFNNDIEMITENKTRNVHVKRLWNSSFGILLTKMDKGM